MGTKPGTGITELSKAASRHREDAAVSFGGGRWRSATYHGGYVVECLLKSRLMKAFDCRNLEELQRRLRARGILAEDRSLLTHELEYLLDLLPSNRALRRDPGALRAFNFVNRWQPGGRYLAESSEKDAEAYLTQVDLLRKWIEGNS